ncbi:hypothetical protein EC5412_1976, partial [Escherichia coli 5412]
MTIRLSDN